MRRGCAVLRRALSSASSRPPRPPVSTSLAALPAAPPLPAPAPEMITPLLDRMDGMTTIVGYDRWGFNVSNVHMRGSVLVLPNFTLLWDVRSVVDISPRSVAPLFMLTPKPEMLLIGAGLGAALHVNPALYTFLSRKGISLEVMSLPRAISTYNLLLGEGRRVAAALVALEPMTRADASLYTDEALSNLVKPRDVRAAQALASDILPQDRLLLEGATSSAAAPPPPSPPPPPPPPPLQQEQKQQRVGYGVSDATRGSPSSVPEERGSAAPRGGSSSTIRPPTESELVQQQAERGKRRSGGWGGGDK